MYTKSNSVYCTTVFTNAGVGLVSVVMSCSGGKGEMTNYDQQQQFYSLTSLK